jgi:hypothetical protein
VSNLEVQIIEGDPSDPATGVAAMKEQLAASERRVKAAESALADARKREEEATSSSASNEVRLLQARQSELQSFADAAKAKIEAAKKLFMDAAEAADAKGQLEATQALTDAKVDLRIAEDGIAEVSGALKTMQERPAAKPADDQMNPLFKDWLSRNPEFRTDRTFNLRARSAHFEAMAEGHAQNSPEYFQFIDGKLQKQTVAPKVPAPEPASLANGNGTPPARETITATPKTPGKITLTAAQADMARSLGMSFQDYHSYMQAIEKGVSPQDFFAARAQKGK